MDSAAEEEAADPGAALELFQQRAQQALEQHRLRLAQARPVSCQASICTLRGRSNCRYLLLA